MTAASTRATTTGSAWAPDLPSSDQWRRWDIEPAWSRLLDVPSHDGGSHRWHLLDTGDPAAADGVDTGPVPVILCVHGNPTWSYAWATFLRRLHPHYRVVAVDQLGMGFSDRTQPRRFADRVRDLDDIIVALQLPARTPLVLAAHDWGGAVAMGWAVQDPGQVAGLILCNTGIAVPEGRSAPGIIRLAASAPLLDAVCRGTPMFVEGTLRLSGRRISKADREAFRAPYRHAPARAAIADFVADIPLRPGHPSERVIADVAGRLRAIDAPVLLAWGALDPVFNDDFAADLAGRFPNTTLQRFASANHLVMAEADVAAVAQRWLEELFDGRLQPGSESQSDVPAREVSPTPPRPLWAGLDERRGDDDDAVVDGATGESITFAALARRVDAIASDLVGRGVEPGDHVAVVTPPGVDLIAVVYGVWRAGGVTVVADRGLGLRGLGRAIRSTNPRWIIGPRKALVAAATLRWAPRATRLNVAALATEGAAPAHEPTGDDLAAVLFTSGATGPAKGVRYLHRQLAAQRDALRDTYDITAADRLVAAFAPFALYGPALGIPTALPDVDVTSPGELTAAALDAACERIGATLTFASPAALANVVATAAAGSVYPALGRLRMILSAGAPVPSETLQAVAALAPRATLRTPYGMTEALPVADIDLTEIEVAEAGEPDGGVCVGHPVTGADVRIAAFDFDEREVPPALEAGVTGEILVRAPWVSDGYLGLWAIERAARPGNVGDWHRTGDVGHLDVAGRLWVEGRAVHMIRTVAGVVTSVPVERLVERALGVRRAAAVGVGPVGQQQLVIVIEDAATDDGPATAEVTERVRSAVAAPVAAVLRAHHLPVDIRHNAKIDRLAVASWAADVLAGRRPSKLA